ncbi:MAG: hypothetical protein VYE22_16235 [Myxococcota bacterium]|nr:hypothetical protein [Myxococcota bacterium]
MNALDRPTILVVGGGERMKTALEEALERHDLMVESVPTEAVVEAAFAAAPDLLLLVGDAAADGGEAALSRLSGHPAAAMVPVVLLSEEGGLDRRLDAFKHGVVAVVEKTASADGMAREIAELASDLPERSGEVGGELGEATVDELVSLFSQRLRTGILSVSAGGGESAQVVLRAGRPVTEAIEELVERLRPLLEKQAGPVRYEFHESPTARLQLLEDEPEADDGEVLRRRRVLLIEQNPARADVLVQELRARGALVAVADGDGNGLERARAHDPDVVVIDGSGVDGWAMPALRKLRRDPRLRWASLLVVDAEQLWPREDTRPDVARLGAALRSLIRPDQQLAERAEREETFDTRLEMIGPSRLLRALTETGRGLKLSVTHPRARVEVDLAEGLLVGARAFEAKGDAELAEGPGALAALLGLGSGRVRVERKDAPSAANVMAPVDDAIAQADTEPAPIRPSLPPPSGIHEPVSLAAQTERAAARDPSELIGKLEALLERLQDVLPAAERAAGPGPGFPPRAKLPPKGALPPRAALPPKPGRPKSPPLKSPPPKPRPHAGALPPAPPKKTPKAKPAAPAAPAPTEPAEPLDPGPATLGESPKPPKKRKPMKTLLGAAAAPVVTPPWEASPPPPPEEEEDDDDDIPVIEATAEPGALEESKPEMPIVHAAPIPSVEPAPIPSEPPPSRGRGLWLAVAAIAILLLASAGGAAAWYLWLRPPPAVVQLPDGPPETPALVTTATVDAGALAAPFDAGLDAGPEDAGIDAGPEDAGIDAGPVDSGLPDAGLPDSGAPAEEDEADDDDPPRGRDVARLIRSANYDRNRGNLREAERTYLQVLRVEGRNPRALAGLTRVAMSRRDGTQAVRWARRLVQAASRNANNHVLLGDALRVAGNQAGARDAYRAALEISPSHRRARARLAGH